MKNLIGTIVLSAASLCVYGQISMLRYNDDFTNVCNDTTDKTRFNKLKHIPIFKDVYISFGGELREQYQYYRNRNFGDAPSSEAGSNSDQLMHRAMAHTNIEIGTRFRVFGQLSSTFRFLNPNPSTPQIDENNLSLHQAFIDYHFNKRWMARVGRQELAYGSHRLITFREGPNTRLAFDAAMIKYQNARKKIDFFVLTPVTSMPGIFDDSTFKDVVYGGYATENLVGRKLQLDYYSMNFISNRRNYNHTSGKENRQSYGFRLFSQNTRFNYEFEATYQTGKFNNLKVRAYSLSADVNYKIHKASNSILGLNGSYVSGDRNPNDKQLNTYNLLFSKPQYGLAAPIGATNIVNISPYFSFTPSKDIGVNAGVNFMWRQSNNDGTYSPLATETRLRTLPLSVSREKEIGKLLSLETNYIISKNLSIAFDASYFIAGKFVAETGKGKDITYLSLKIGCKF